MRNFSFLNSVAFGCSLVLIVASVVVGGLSVHAQSNPSSAPPWLPVVHLQALESPLPAHVQYATGTVPATVHQNETDPNQTGQLGTYNPDGPTYTSNNGFFQPLGTNGRACITCHQPPNGMSISAANVQSRYLATLAQDPIFAPVDGAVCPDAVPAINTLPSPIGGLLGTGTTGLLGGLLSITDPSNPYKLLLNRGLIRVFLPWPPKAADGSTIKPEFTIQVLSDPTKCENNSIYGLKSANPVLSIYRRPLMSSNLKFVTTLGQGFPPVDPLTGVPQATDPFTGQPESGNIMWDGREPTLQSQAVDATLGHAQALNPPTDAQVKQIVDFENAVFSAQTYDNKAHSLTGAGATGGPAHLAAQQAGIFGITAAFDEYSNWATLSNTVEQYQQRKSVARGQAIFNSRTFTISNVAGFNDVSFVGNNVPGTCATCHNQMHGGTDVLPNAERDLGVAGNSSASFPATDLPLFKLTCVNGASTPYNGTTVTVRDLGKALLTGKCADIGKIKVPQLRGLAAHAPYFHDGSAATLQDVVNFYNKRFNINLTYQETQDLINFLNTL
jgi:cytochrome c peroxidase